MNTYRSRWVAFAVGAALVIAFLPSLAGATPVRAHAKPKRSVKAQRMSSKAETFTADAFEPDDTTATAHSLDGLLGSTLVGGHGQSFITQSHTFSIADTTTGDQDWYKFTVSATDIDNGTSWLIESHSADPAVDTVIEVYGPGPECTPSDPIALDGNTDLELGTLNCVAANDDSEFMDLGSSVMFSPSLFATQTAGVYYFRVRPFADSGGYGNGAGPYTLRIKRGQTARAEGPTRIDTAIAMSKEKYSTYPVASQPMAVVLAYSRNYPDALAGAALAGAARGPLLLTEKDSLPSSVRDEIIRTGADTVYILGSGSAIATSVLDAVAAIDPGITAIRVAGASRFDTAQQIAYEASTYGIGTTAIVANGFNWPDALAATPLSYANGFPIVPTAKDVLTPVSRSLLTSPTFGITDVIVMGSEKAVSAAVFNDLASIVGTDHVLRLAGASRYETANNFAKWATDKTGPGIPDDGTLSTTGTANIGQSLTYGTIGVASGEGFPDALGGGALCGAAFSPLLLTPNTYVTPYFFDDGTVVPFEDTYIGAGGGEPISRIYLFGSSKTVNNPTAADLDYISGQSWTP